MSYIAIWKYYNEPMEYYFAGDAAVITPCDYVDRWKTERMSVAGFPIFDLKVEKTDGVLEYQAGNFNLSF